MILWISDFDSIRNYFKTAAKSYREEYKIYNKVFLERYTMLFNLTLPILSAEKDFEKLNIMQVFGFKNYNVEIYNKQLIYHNYSDVISRF